MKHLLLLATLLLTSCSGNEAQLNGRIGQLEDENTLMCAISYELWHESKVIYAGKGDFVDVATRNRVHVDLDKECDKIKKNLQGSFTSRRNFYLGG